MTRWKVRTVLLGVLLSGCNSGGIMELELSLPPAPDTFDIGPCTGAGTCAEGACEDGRCIYRGPWYSQVEVTSRFDFVNDAGPLQWQPATWEPIVLAQSGSDTRWSCTSVLGDPSVATLRVRLRYCRSLPCSDSLDPHIEHWLEIERPFYGNRRTYVRRIAPSIPTTSDRCTTDVDCASAAQGPRCLPNRARCGCTDDAQCTAGHCEGAQTALGGGRCTVDVSRCFVTGCVNNADPLEAGNACHGEADTHACEGGDTVEYAPPSGTGCIRQGSP